MPFNEGLFLPDANIDPDKALRCTQIQGMAQPIDRQFLSNFLLDFVWASSLLLGSSYTELDTAALVKYGKKMI